MDDLLKIGQYKFKSRLLTGSGKYSSNNLIPKVINASQSEIITIAIRQVELNSVSKSLFDFIPEGLQLLPNTSGARNADEAIKIARIARKLGCGN